MTAFLFFSPVFSHHQTRSWTPPCFQLHTTPAVRSLTWPTSSSLLRSPPRWTLMTAWPSPPSAPPTAQAVWLPTSPTWASVWPVMVITHREISVKHCFIYIYNGFLFLGIPTSSQTTMTVTAQRRQPSVVPLTLTSDLTLQGSPQQLSPTGLSSPINITQVRLICAGRGLWVPLLRLSGGGNIQSFTQTFAGSPTQVEIQW